jgi:hypothetical protein
MNATAVVVPVLLEQKKQSLTERVTQLPATLARCDAALIQLSWQQSMYSKMFNGGMQAVVLQLTSSSSGSSSSSRQQQALPSCQAAAFSAFLWALQQQGCCLSLQCTEVTGDHSSNKCAQVHSDTSDQYHAAACCICAQPSRL